MLSYHIVDSVYSRSHTAAMEVDMETAFWGNKTNKYTT